MRRAGKRGIDRCLVAGDVVKGLVGGVDRGRESAVGLPRGLI
jgi:hypothetical protein